MRDDRSAITIPRRICRDRGRRPARGNRQRCAQSHPQGRLLGPTGTGRGGIANRGHIDQFARKGWEQPRPGACQDGAASHGLNFARCCRFASRSRRNTRTADAERLGDIRSRPTPCAFISRARRRWQAVSGLFVERHPARGSGGHQSRDEQGQSVYEVRRYLGRPVQGIGRLYPKAGRYFEGDRNNVPSDATIRNRRLVEATKKVQRK